MQECFVHSQCLINVYHRNVVLKGSIPACSHSLGFYKLPHRPPEDKQHLWPLNLRGENAIHLKAQVTAQLCLKYRLGRRLAWGAVAGPGRLGNTNGSS